MNKSGGNGLEAVAVTGGDEKVAGVKGGDGRGEEAERKIVGKV